MVSLRAPLSGIVWPLERIPDPVFAQKMVGDGASIDPIDAVLVAPCDGDVLSLHPAGHAVTLRTAEGAEILLHIGIDTVALKGEGFHPMVSAGDTVRVGAPLISFDLDYLATHAKSLLTQVVITNGHGLTNWERATGQVVAGKDLLFSVNFVSPEKARRDGSCRNDHLGCNRDSESDWIARATRGGAGESRERFSLVDQTSARRSAGKRAQHHCDHGARCA